MILENITKTRLCFIGPVYLFRFWLLSSCFVVRQIATIPNCVSGLCIRVLHYILQDARNLFAEPLKINTLGLFAAWFVCRAEILIKILQDSKVSSAILLNFFLCWSLGKLTLDLFAARFICRIWYISITFEFFVGKQLARVLYIYCCIILKKYT